MSLVAALATVVRVGTEVRDATDAATATLAAGGSPVDALHAFAAASANQLDDEAVAVLDDALRRAITVCGAIVTAAAWVAEHEDDVRAAVDRTVGAVVAVGYAAGRWRRTLDAWGA